MHAVTIGQIAAKQHRFSQQCRQYRARKGVVAGIVAGCGKGAQFALRHGCKLPQQVQMQKIIHGRGLKPGQRLLKAQALGRNARKIARCGLRLLMGIGIIEHRQIKVRPCRMHRIIVFHNNPSGMGLTKAVWPWLFCHAMCGQGKWHLISYKTTRKLHQKKAGRHATRPKKGSPPKRGLP